MPAKSQFGLTLKNGEKRGFQFEMPVAPRVNVTETVAAPVPEQNRLLTSSNGTPQEALTSFYNAINQQNFNAAANLLWDRPIGGVDISGLRQALIEAKSNGLVLNRGNLH